MVSEFIKSVKVKQNTDANCYVKFGLKPLEAPKTVRIRFSKTGSLQYISHLDLQRLWSRALVRAGIPLWYTQGFNPHAKMVFALPLPVGVESRCELLDVRIDREIPCEDIKELLNSELTDELCVLDVYYPQSKFADISSAEYNIELSSINASESLVEKINDFFASDEILMVKHTKSGEKEINIARLIHSFRAEYRQDGVIAMNTKLSAGTESLNPEFLINALRKYGVLAPASLTEESYSIVRTKVYNINGEEYF